MNLFQLLIGLVVLGGVVTLGLRNRKSGVSEVSGMSGVSRMSTTNLLLLGIVGLLGFFAYQFIQSETREAIRTGDYSRCWTDGCKSRVTYEHYLR